MTCHDAKELLHGYVDGELDLMNSLEIERHLGGCDSCSRAYQSQLNLKRAFQAAPLHFSASEELRRRIQSSVRSASDSLLERRGLAWLPSLKWVGVVAAMALVAVVSWNIGRGGRAPDGDAVLVQEVIDSHIRSLMANHLEDVPSTDQHTVKPWFNGKLDFSPPVQDYSKDGYPLVGGRLDYVEGRPAAALVYQRRKHFINLFVWPSPQVALATQEPIVTRQGYNLLHWVRGGMSFWAVSDLNGSELQEFVQLVQSQGSAAP